MRSTTFPPSPLRAYRAGQGFSQAELAELAGLSRETISRLEQGATPHLATAHAIATALGAPMAAIFPTQDEGPMCVPGPVNSAARQGRHDTG
jgi:transcriptional regulator with XRE-family HTH domain